MIRLLLFLTLAAAQPQPKPIHARTDDEKAFNVAWHFVFDSRVRPLIHELERHQIDTKALRRDCYGFITLRKSHACAAGLDKAASQLPRE